MDADKKEQLNIKNIKDMIALDDVLPQNNSFIENTDGTSSYKTFNSPTIITSSEKSETYPFKKLEIKSNELYNMTKKNRRNISNNTQSSEFGTSDSIETTEENKYNIKNKNYRTNKTVNISDYKAESSGKLKTYRGTREINSMFKNTQNHEELYNALGLNQFSRPVNTHNGENTTKLGSLLGVPQNVPNLNNNADLQNYYMQQMTQPQITQPQMVQPQMLQQPMTQMVQPPMYNMFPTSSNNNQQTPNIDQNTLMNNYYASSVGTQGPNPFAIPQVQQNDNLQTIHSGANTAQSQMFNPYTSMQQGGGVKNPFFFR
ncbi:hypothetical protein EON73_03765 [bacterium]|nr:MAG: hypothetical protein EON73_03765 [bacterium]